MLETHPFGNFVPNNATTLILGSFTGRQAVKGKSYTYEAYDWFYGTPRNQFWPMIEAVYGVALPTKKSKQDLFTKHGIAITDIIYQCERQDGNNSDSNLKNIVYNQQAILEIVASHPIQTILFTSRFVERKFRAEFKHILEGYPNIEYHVLPSPSPRYASMKKEEKIKRYHDLLPK
ncbi:MAG: DNA-deoxyinosine glycosylase [Anaerolineaceae bacterium]|nr:DNA-deoxyinosine glycosylase [Anaerolineaceae bacterium]